MPSLEALLAMPRAGLAAALAAGHAIDPAALDDSAYEGTSLGLPGWIERLTWKKFQKVFHRDPATGELRGWNVRLAQNGVGAPCVPLVEAGERVTFGHYRVAPMEGYTPPKPCGPGLMLDYKFGARGALDPLGALRDPIVALEPGSVEHLLGWSYLDVAGVPVSTPSYFALRRVGQLDHVVAR